MFALIHITVLVAGSMSPKMMQINEISNSSAVTESKAGTIASSYVPIESWVYATIDRLAAEGYVRSAFVGLRPWTREQCALFVEEARKKIALDAERPEDSASLLRSLDEEFAVERQRLHGHRNRELRLESMDQRNTFIAGTPLRDGLHFAETLVDDYGRPFAQGVNDYSGISLRATAGHFAGYVHAEVQRTPFAASPDASVQQQIAVVDFTTYGAAGPVSGFTRGRLLDANVSYAVSGNQVTFGKQTLWWGPARSATTLMSNNAEPLTMFRYDRVAPITLPGFLRALGSIRTQLFVGRTNGAQFVQARGEVIGGPGVSLGDQPFIHGEKFSFKFTDNFEFSISRTVLFGGAGAPVTTATFLRSVFSLHGGVEEKDPGDRRIAIDANYRIPGMHNCLSGYVDGFSDDQPFPATYPTESSWISGFFLRCVPALPHVTLRAEGLLTPHRDLAYPGFFYFNDHYLSGYTNSRQLMGSWIGREGDGEQVWATWNMSPRSFVETSFRSMDVNREFLRGGALRDFKVAASLQVCPEWQLRMEEQAEWWRFPLLSATPRWDNAITLQLSYQPHARTKP